MRVLLGYLFNATSLLASLYLLYFWFMKSNQNIGAVFPLGMGWLFSAQLQLLSIIFTILNRYDKAMLLLGTTSFIVFTLSTAYFILFVKQ
jgi:hypothetical protein